MSKEKKKGSKPVSPKDVAKQLQTSITKVATLPKGPCKKVDAKKTERRFAKDNQESE